jgi:hypothetical protein
MVYNETNERNTMENTMLTSLYGARDKLINDSFKLEDQICAAKDDTTRRYLLARIEEVYIKLGEIGYQIREIIMTPVKPKTIWQKLFEW